MMSRNLYSVDSAGVGAVVIVDGAQRPISNDNIDSHNAHCRRAILVVETGFDQAPRLASLT